MTPNGSSKRENVPGRDGQYSSYVGTCYNGSGFKSEITDTKNVTSGDVHYKFITDDELVVVRVPSVGRIYGAKSPHFLFFKFITVYGGIFFFIIIRSIPAIYATFSRLYVYICTPSSRDGNGWCGSEG